MNFYLQLKNAYAVAKLRKSGYSKQKFYNEAFELYKEVCFCHQEITMWSDFDKLYLFLYFGCWCFLECHIFFYSNLLR